MVFHHDANDLSLAVHGGDFTICGVEGDFWWLKKEIQSCFEIKVWAVLGKEKEQDKEDTILGRVVSWTDEVIAFEADPETKQRCDGEFDGESGFMVSNVAKEDGVQDDEGVPMRPKEAAQFRTIVATLNFLGQDCPSL